MGTRAQTASEITSPCIARQPILTVDETVVGYELFFREGPTERHFTSDGESATATAIDSLILMGLGALCDGRLAFINCTQQILLSECLALLPAGDVAIEIQADVAPSDEVAKACSRLKESGYRIALDNFALDDPRADLVRFADFIKVDIRRYYADDRRLLVSRYSSNSCVMLAHKVETREQFVTAKNGGFKRFQGYFFRQPESVRSRQLPTNQISRVRLLSATSKSQVDFAEIESLIKYDPSLCYRLLRYLNSPLLGLSSEVQSVRHALELLGERESVRWIRMATALVMAQEKCSDLLLSSLVRARFCELIAPKVEHGKSDLFLLGMLSLMDALLAVPMGLVVEELSLDPNIKAQLLRAKTKEKTKLSPIYDLMLARESGNWEQVTKLSKELNLSLVFVAEAFNEAMRWAHQVTSAGEAQKNEKKANK